MFCGHIVKILNNFIFEFVFCKWSSMWQRTMLWGLEPCLIPSLYSCLLARMSSQLTAPNPPPTCLLLPHSKTTANLYPGRGLDVSLERIKSECIYPWHLSERFGSDCYHPELAAAWCAWWVTSRRPYLRRGEPLKSLSIIPWLQSKHWTWPSEKV